jgi:cysteine desulfurase/selenocysteine lyase
MSMYKKDFPIFKHKYRGHDLVYLDSAATSQKPQVVIDAVSNFYQTGCANIGRAVYDLGEQATIQYNAVRRQVAEFINSDFSEVVFTSGATSAINLVAHSWGRKFIKPGDEIIISISEHHANFVTWQALASQTGATLKILGLTSNYDLDLESYQKLLTSKTKLVAITASSNVLGVLNQLELITKLAKQADAAVLIDASQAISYTQIDVAKLACDFLVFSGHKMLAPDGVGVLYINQIWHDQIFPDQFGGGMVSSVGIEQSTFLPAPAKFEAGTPPIASIIGLGAAISYYQKNLPYDMLQAHLANLCRVLIDGLNHFAQIKIIGNQKQLATNGHLVSFVVNGFHAHDVAAYLDQFGICVRAGHHCAQPLHDYLGESATIRVSFHAYNTVADVEYLLVVLGKLIQQGF